MAYSTNFKICLKESPTIFTSCVNCKVYKYFVFSFRMKFLLAISLLACTLGAYADEEIKKEEGVLVLTEKNFDQVTNLTRHCNGQLHHDVDDAFELFNIILFSRPSLTTSSSLLSFTPHGAVTARPSLPSTLRLPASWPRRSLPSS